MSTEWNKSENNHYIGNDRNTGDETESASRVDLIFGSNSQLRAISEVYAVNDSKDVFLSDFIRAWNKVMNFDRFDLNS